MKKLILTGLLSLIASTSLLAKDFNWEQIAHTPDGHILYADNNFDEGQDFVWVKWDPIPFETPEYKFADSVMLKIYLNCEKNLMKIADASFLKNDKIIKTDIFGKDTRYKKISANTMFSEIADWFCSSENWRKFAIY